MRVVVLGSTGMLGQSVEKESCLAGLEVVSVSRTSGVLWDYFKSNFESLASTIGLSKDDILVNCIGWIPQKKTGSDAQDEHDAEALNVHLIKEIQSSQNVSGFKWVQILTDCVFNGQAGHYSEEATPQPVDLYGVTKAIGETLMPGAMRIRSSIIGPDPLHRSGLYEWFKRQPENSRIQGYSDHLWNGVSTKAFGRLVAGLAAGHKVQPSLQHWIPLDSLSKYELILLFRDKLRRRDIGVDEFPTRRPVNRVLTTSHPEANSDLWATAGFNRIPSIEELVSDFILDNREEDY